MQRFKTIAQHASDRHGGDAALKKLMPKVRSARALSATGDDRYFAVESSIRCCNHLFIPAPIRRRGVGSLRQIRRRTDA